MTVSVTIQSLAPWAACGTVAMVGVAALTVRVEVAAKRWDLLTSKIMSQRHTQAITSRGLQADNRWLSSIIETFED